MVRKSQSDRHFINLNDDEYRSFVRAKAKVDKTQIEPLTNGKMVKYACDKI